MMILSILTGIVVIAVIVTPFFFGRGGLLAAAATQSSPEKLKVLQEAVVERYLRDQQAFQAKEIGERAWRDRKKFLLNRYVDAARRLDYLEKIQSAEPNSGSESES
jgi:hypothetical protein